MTGGKGAGGAGAAVTGAAVGGAAVGGLAVGPLTMRGPCGTNPFKIFRTEFLTISGFDCSGSLMAKFKTSQSASAAFVELKT